MRLSKIELQHAEVLNSLRETLIERGYSISAIKQYGYTVKRFLAFHSQLSPSDMKATEIVSFLEHIDQAGKSASTKNAMINALRYLYRYVLKTDYAGLTHLERSPMQSRAPDVITQSEIDRVEAMLEGAYALQFKLLYGSGLRLMECMHLRAGDIDLSRQRIIVRDERGYEDRETILEKNDVEALRAHLLRRKAQHRLDLAAGKAAVDLPEAFGNICPTAWELQFVFPALTYSRDPQSGIVKRHHQPGVLLQRAMKQAILMAGLEKQITPHALRHSFAARMLESGYDTKTVQILLGHARESTTIQFYGKFIMEDLCD